MSQTPAWRKSNVGMLSRRTILTVPIAVVEGALRSRGLRATNTDEQFVAVSVKSEVSGNRVFERQNFGTVGIFDVDWLIQPQFTQLLDNFAASPGAFHGVRFFGSFTSGQREAFIPESGGNVWTRADRPIDFTTTFHALDALATRGLIPFVVLGFFPPAISSSPIRPPAAWDHWKTLVRTFFRDLATDPRFGLETIADWWFEVWNEPNEGRFWQGTPDDYFALYRATAEAVDEVGASIRLGGPAIAYKPQVTPDDGPPWMERFLRFIAANPELRCDFVSLHRKGTVEDDPPDPRRLDAASADTARQALAIDARRFAGLTIWNNEADEKVGFEVPYAPRIDERGAAWLATVAVIHDQLGERFREADLRFAAAADNANLQLVRSPFDGRRSIMTRVGTSQTDLLKVPAYGFYELLRLLGDRHGAVVSGSARLFPYTDLYHLTTVATTHVASLLTYYPDPETEARTPHTVEYVIRDLPWPRVNIARFQIDRVSSNAYTAAGGSPSNPYPIPAPEQIHAIRQHQEIALMRPIERDIAVSSGTYTETLTLEPFTTLCLWITPVLPTAPQAPTWIETAVHGRNAIVRWSPSQEPFFYGYEVFRLQDGVSEKLLTPDPLRSALWIDTAPSPGHTTYGVRAISASGVASPIAVGDESRCC
jgi:Glycosyl hydrolases family 39